MKPRAGATKLGCLLNLLFLATILYFGIPAAETYMRYVEYKDAMKQELRFRGNQSNDKIKARLRMMADSLGLPPEAGYVTVTRKGQIVSVEAEYEEMFDLPGFRKAVRFNPRASDTY